jgi:hypothetical protein
MIYVSISSDKNVYSNKMTYRNVSTLDGVASWDKILLLGTSYSATGTVTETSAKNIHLMPRRHSVCELRQTVGYFFRGKLKQRWESYLLPVPGHTADSSSVQSMQLHVFCFSENKTVTRRAYWHGRAGVGGGGGGGVAPVCCGNMRSCRALKIQRTSVGRTTWQSQKRGQPFRWSSYYSYFILMGGFQNFFLGGGKCLCTILCIF